MKREQIIGILKSYRIWFGDAMAIHEDAFNNLADEILALPLDVPSDEEIKDKIFANDPVSDSDPEWIYGFRQGQFTGAKMMRDEIIKRNK